MRDTVAGGYADPAYAAALARRRGAAGLPRCGGSLLVRPTPDAADPRRDRPLPAVRVRGLVGPGARISTMLRDQLVSVSLVADPFGGWTAEGLRACFPDLMAPFKEHHVVDLGADAPASARTTAATRARRCATSTWRSSTRPADLLDDWIALYDNLVRRHEITRHRGVLARGVRGAVRGPRPRRAARLGGGRDRRRHALVRPRRRRRTTTCGAYSERGYELKASFALFATALEHFAAARASPGSSLGAGAGVGDGAGDGLDRFKRRLGDRHAARRISAGGSSRRTATGS